MTKTTFETSKISYTFPKVLQVLTILIFFASLLNETRAYPLMDGVKDFPNKYGVILLSIFKTPHGFIERESTRPCRCPRIYWPVCGTDDQMYVNYCARKCLGASGSRQLTPNCINGNDLMVIVPSSWIHPEEIRNITEDYRSELLKHVKSEPIDEDEDI